MDPGARTTGFTRLFRDGALVAQNTAPGNAAVSVPDGSAGYRLEAGVTPIDNPTGARWEISTHVTASWTFRSAKADGLTPLPLMAVRFQPDLDGHNRAPAGRAFQIPVRVEHQPGARNVPVTNLTVQTSYDDGATWQPVPLIRTAASWRMMIANPIGGSVSLRAMATDADGNTVEQTIERAYLVAAPARSAAPPWAPM